MTTIVETYRGYPISFDTFSEEFSCALNDMSVNKKSFPAVKKAIDDYIKDNSKFQPFKVHHENDFGSTFTIVGVRKDNRFIYENNKGEKGQVSEYDERNYYLVVPENGAVYTSIAGIKSQINDLYAKIEKERAKLKITTLKDYKKTLPLNS